MFHETTDMKEFLYAAAVFCVLMTWIHTIFITTAQKQLSFLENATRRERIMAYMGVVWTVFTRIVYTGAVVFLIKDLLMSSSNNLPQTVHNIIQHATEMTGL